MVMQICKTVASAAVRQSCELVASSVVARFAPFLRQPCNKHGTNLYKQNGQFCVWRLKKGFLLSCKIAKDENVVLRSGSSASYSSWCELQNVRFYLNRFCREINNLPLHQDTKDSEET